MISKTLLFPFLMGLIDQIWLQGAKSYHHSMIISIQKSDLQFSLLAGILWYILAGVAYHYFVLPTKDVFFYGFLMGLAMYGTFDLTNKFIFRDYTWIYALSDMMWGSFCFAITSWILSKI
jgi:uncharacterized membrane protein